MNTKHLLVATVIGGLISTLLVNTPFINLINLLICAGFWVGPIVAVWVYRRQGGTVTLSQALVIGMLAGVWHGFFGLVLSLVGLAGASGLFNELRPFISPQDLPDLETALTGVGGLFFNLFGIVVDVAFGFIGGLVGGAFFSARRAIA